MAGLRPPQIFLVYAPRGAGLRGALGYLSSGQDVYGWFAGPDAGHAVRALYFIVEGFYSPAGQPRYVAAQTLDLHAGWTTDGARCHELARMQDAFFGEWLFDREDPRRLREVDEYAGAELALGALNVRFAKLAKFSTLQANWTFYSPGFERPVLNFVSRHWPLEYRPERAPAL